MPNAARRRHVVVLAPMPLEMQAIVTAFGLSPESHAKDGQWKGRIGESDVTAVHIGMGPPLTRAAVSHLLDDTRPDHTPVDHVMIAGICGGLAPDLAVGTLINPEYVIEHATGTTYRHTPPGDAPQRGSIITTEEATLDIEQSKRFFEAGCLGVDMENSAVAEVCEASGCPWSVYRCIGDRWFDSLLDERIVAATNMDGSGNLDALRALIAAEPDIGAKLEQLSKDTTMAARLAAEAAVRGCLALDD
jgi:adenosylhomocysteine nucleosidase